jgi:glycine cleavage system aminomethyltransferase T
VTFSIHIGPNIRTSPYFEATVADGVRSFSVYNHMAIPGHFGDPEAEYDRLLNGVAMWDVAAQRQVQLEGPDAMALAQLLTPRNLAGTKVGQGRYVPMCDHDGWLINDPVLLPLSDTCVWLSIADSDIALWAAAIGRERGLDVTVSEPDVSPLAIQGPKAMDVAEVLFGDLGAGALKYFQFREAELDGIPLIVARSGWSKQGGVELYLRDGGRGTELWHRVKEAGAPFGIGPGAPNDIERLESGLISYGADMRRQTPARQSLRDGVRSDDRPWRGP